MQLENDDASPLRAGPDGAGAARGHSALKGIVSTAGAGSLSILAGLLLLPVIFASIGTGPYGVWLVLFTAVLLSQYADLGVGTAIIHFSSRARAGKAKEFSKFLVAGLVWNCAVAMVLMPIFVVLASAYVYGAKASEVVVAGDRVWLVACASIAFGSLLLRPFSSALIGAGLTPIDQRNQLIATTVRVILTLSICLASPSLRLLVAAEALCVVLPYMLAAFAVMRRRLIDFDLGGCRQTLGIMFRYSLPSFGTAVIGSATLQCGTVIAGTALSPESASYYAAAFRVYTAARQVLTWIIEPFRSAFSYGFIAEPEKTRDHLRSLGFIVAITATALAVLGLLAAPSIIAVWLPGQDNRNLIVATLMVLLASLPANALYLPMAMAADAKGRPGLFLATNTLWLISTVGLALILTPDFGIVGIALGLSLPTLVVVPVNLWLARSALGLSLRLWARAVVFKVVAMTALPIVAGVVVLVVSGNHLSRPNASVLATVVFAAAQTVWLVMLRSRLDSPGVVRLVRSKL